MATIYQKNGQSLYDSNGATYDAKSGQVVSGSPQGPDLSAPAPASTNPVTTLSTQNGITELQKTQKVAASLVPPPATTTTTPTSPAPSPATATTVSKVTLVNPTTGQNVVFDNPDLNKDNIQSYMNNGYSVSDASGNIPSWLSPSASTPQGAAATQAETNLKSAADELTAAKAKLTNFDVSNDPQLQGILSGITGQWDTRIGELKKAQDSQLAALNTTGIRIGSQYTGGAGGVFGGILSTQEQGNISKIADMESQKQMALTQAKQAFESGKWSQYAQLVDLAQHSYDQQLSAVQDLQKAQAAQDAKLKEQADASKVDSTIGTLLSAGVTDPTTILATLTKSGMNATAEQVQKSMAALMPQGLNDIVKTISQNGAPPDVIQKVLASGSINEAYQNAGDYSSGGSGIVGEYNFYKAQAKAAGQTPVDFNTYQTMDANRKAKASAAGSTNTADLAQQLVEGLIAPSDLSKRGDYNAIIAAANNYSKATYGQPFSASQASRDYKFATNINTQNTLNYLGSLVGTDDGSGNLKGGNLDELIAQSKAIGRTNLPALNNVAAWARLSLGDPKIAAFQATATEVADQIAKILQGGGSSGTSDAKLQQAANLFNTGFSPAQIEGVVNGLKPLLANRATSMIKNNPYLSDYANQFGVQQAGPSGKGSTGSQLILTEQAAKSKIIDYGKSNPSAQQNITKIISSNNPETGQPYTYSDAAQILGIK